MAELSARYAAALFDLAMESGASGEYLEQAVFLREALSGAECKGILSHPNITAEQKREFLRGAFDGNIHDGLLGFLYLATAKNRERFIIPALTAFISAMEDQLKRATANVTSAVALSPDQISALRQALSSKLNKQVDVSLKVDPSLIGGMYIHVDGYFIDRTIKNQLRDMKVNLKRGTANGSQT